MVLAANAERTPAAQYTTTGRDLSGIRPSTWNSSWPRGRCTRAGDGTLLVLVGLADVEPHDAVVVEARLDLVGLGLADGRLGLVQQLSGTGHDDHDLPAGFGGTASPPSLLSCKPYQRGQHSQAGRRGSDRVAGPASALG